MLIREEDLAKSAGDPFDASPWLIWPGINADCMKFWSLKAIVYLPYLLKVLLLSFFSHPQPNESCQQNRTTVSMPEAERLPLGKLPPEYRQHFFPEPGAHCCWWQMARQLVLQTSETSCLWNWPARERSHPVSNTLWAFWKSWTCGVHTHCALCTGWHSGALECACDCTDGERKYTLLHSVACDRALCTNQKLELLAPSLYFLFI